MDRAERADQLHRRGYNCCQAVACVFAEEVGMDEATLYRVAEGFGAGMGTAKGVCGAVSGAAIISGLVNSDGNIDAPGQTKAKSTKAAGTIQRKFTEQAKALICKGWFFSGLNWPIETSKCSEVAFSSCKGRSKNVCTSQGG